MEWNIVKCYQLISIPNNINKTHTFAYPVCRNNKYNGHLIVVISSYSSKVKMKIHDSA